MKTDEISIVRMLQEQNLHNTNISDGLSFKIVKTLKSWFDANKDDLSRVYDLEMEELKRLDLHDKFVDVLRCCSVPFRDLSQPLAFNDDENDYLSYAEALNSIAQPIEYNQPPSHMLDDKGDEYWDSLFDEMARNFDDDHDHTIDPSFELVDGMAKADDHKMAKREKDLLEKERRSAVESEDLTAVTSNNIRFITDKHAASKDTSSKLNATTVSIIPHGDPLNKFNEDLIRYSDTSNDDFVVKKSSDGSVVVRKANDRFYVENKNLLSTNYLLQVALLAKENSDVAEILIPDRLSNKNRLVFFNNMKTALLDAGFNLEDISPQQVPDRTISLKEQEANDAPFEKLSSTKSKTSLPDYDSIERAINSHSGDATQNKAAKSILKASMALGHPYTLAQFAEKLWEIDNSIRVSVQRNIVEKSSDTLSLSFIIADGKAHKFITASELCADKKEKSGVFGVNAECFLGCTFDPTQSEHDYMKMAMSSIRDSISLENGIDVNEVQYSDLYSYLKKGKTGRHKTNVFKRSLLASTYNIIPDDSSFGNASSKVNMYNCKQKYNLSELIDKPTARKNKMADDIYKKTSTSEKVMSDSECDAKKIERQSKCTSTSTSLRQESVDGEAVECEAVFGSGVCFGSNTPL